MENWKFRKKNAKAFFKLICICSAITVCQCSWYVKVGVYGCTGVRDSSLCSEWYAEWTAALPSPWGGRVLRVSARGVGWGVAPQGVCMPNDKRSLYQCHWKNDKQKSIQEISIGKWPMQKNTCSMFLWKKLPIIVSWQKIIGNYIINFTQYRCVVKSYWA